MQDRTLSDHVIIDIRELQALASRQPPAPVISFANPQDYPAAPAGLIEFFNLVPDEMIVRILRSLPAADVIRLSQVNRRFHAICDEYLTCHLQKDMAHLKIRFFRKQQERLNDDIEALQDTKTGCRQISGQMAGGAVLAAIIGYFEYLVAQTSAGSSRDLKIILAAFFVISILVFLKGLFDAVKNCMADCQVSGLSGRINALNDDIDLARQIMRRP
ncbi:hypothetical protein AQUSIP_00200 [Aquicella siphonis]|uniref:F-box domain-containing protein n=1 Tax=Aquicella siphonis TaxID=254247 RepID=A0A5E4PE35_9COXI|nr:F-box protein [Aquicella siphonis]VVC74748.1 hypothetical protein AQUSIP_00200 [Aquicella siphonis]